MIHSKIATRCRRVAFPCGTLRRKIHTAGTGTGTGTSTIHMKKTEQITTLSSWDVSTNVTKAFDIPISVADVHLRHEQLPFAYFFEGDLDPQKLKESFSQVLEFFPTAGGTLENYQRIHCSPEDTVPLSFADANMTLHEWLAVNRGHLHQSGNGDHPSLLPIFDPLFHSNIDAGGMQVADADVYTKKDLSLPTQNLLSAKVTRFEHSSGLVIAINANHLLGDTASCVRFAECWGLQYSGEDYRKPCLNRSNLSSTGMMSPKVVDLIHSHTSEYKDKNINSSSASSSSLFDSIFGTNTCSSEEETNGKSKSKSKIIDHEYVSLPFPSNVVDAMKAHGMETCRDNINNGMEDNDLPTYISRNDTIMAVTWLLKKLLSNESNTNLSIVMNLRGRCGLDNFEQCNDDDFETKSGLFGNGIVNVFAEYTPSNNLNGTRIDISNVSAASIAIRTALIEGSKEILYRLEQSKVGTPTQSSTKPMNDGMTSNCFSITSWRQLSPKNVAFSDTSPLLDFHGQPSHPIPSGRTYTSVVHENIVNNAGATVDLFLPSDQKDIALQIHGQVCVLFLEWYENKKSQQHSTMQM